MPKEKLNMNSENLNNKQNIVSQMVSSARHLCNSEVTKEQIKRTRTIMRISFIFSCLSLATFFMMKSMETWLIYGVEYNTVLLLSVFITCHLCYIVETYKKLEKQYICMSKFTAVLLMPAYFLTKLLFIFVPKDVSNKINFVADGMAIIGFISIFEALLIANLTPFVTSYAPKFLSQKQVGIIAVFFLFFIMFVISKISTWLLKLICINNNETEDKIKDIEKLTDILIAISSFVSLVFVSFVFADAQGTLKTVIDNSQKIYAGVLLLYSAINKKNPATMVLNQILKNLKDISNKVDKILEIVSQKK